MNPLHKYLAKRVAIQRPVLAPDGAGGATTTWQTLTTLWMHIDAMRGRRVMQSDQVGSAVTHRFTLRRRTDLSPDMRLQYGTRIFDISAILLDGGKAYEMQIDAVERSVS